MTLDLSPEMFEHLERASKASSMKHTDYIRSMIESDMDPERLVVPMPEELIEHVRTAASTDFLEPELYARNAIIEHLRELGVI